MDSMQKRKGEIGLKRCCCHYKITLSSYNKVKMMQHLPVLMKQFISNNIFAVNY